MVISSELTERRPLLVLLVDDSPEDCQMVRRFLTRDNALYRLIEAPSIAKTIALMAAERPDCVLLDFNLIDGDGLGLMRRLMTEHGAHAFGIIMLTGSGEASLAVEAMKSGAHDYVEKNGLTAPLLSRSVENAIEKAGIQRELAERRQQLAQKNDELAAHVIQLQHEAMERNRADAAARATAQQLRTVTDHLPINIAQFDRQFRYRFANVNFTARFAKKPEDVVGKTIVEVVGTEVFETYREKMELALSGQHVQFEMSAHMPQGERWMSISYMPERDDSGEVIGFVAVSIDISERRQAELAVAQSRDQAVAATQSRDNFLAALSHELRTPLNPVLLMASASAENTELSDEVRADFAAIRNHVELEARLIDDLLDLSRISTGKLALQLQPLALHGALRNTVAIVKSEIEQKEIRLKLEFAAADPSVVADEVRLQQVFWNILKNAVKFTPAGGTVAISTEVDAIRNLVTVRISDTGIGLSTEEVPRIFEAFSQGDHAINGRSHRFGGLGLGLAITRKLVETHGGRIAAESEGVNRGATFAVELPLATGAGVAMREQFPHGLANRNENDAPKGAATNRQNKILLVEDHASTRASLTMLLERRRFTVVAVPTCTQAQAAVKESDFDLVISDIGLPDGDGYACMLALRKMRPRIRGIALSGYGMEEDRRRSHEVGFTEHLTKPVNMQSLDRAIANALATGPNCEVSANEAGPVTGLA